VIFFCDGEGAFLQGFLRKVVCRTWFFGGEFVVGCWWIMVRSMVFFRR
jgi:hypothetical protein